MAKEQPRPPRGMRDWLPEPLRRREHIFRTVRTVFEAFGFQAIETPAMEMLSTLTGKYGEEGDQLLYKVLNSGDYLNAVRDEPDWPTWPAAKLAPLLCDRGLRYDLTVPLARFVVNHRNDLTFPFKRYQIQPVWRADSPQKGRYREFTQCDADAVGSASLLLDAECLALYDGALGNLGLPGIRLRLNHRRLLSGLAAHLGVADRWVELCMSLDKLDKVGPQGVRDDLAKRGFDPQVGQGLDFLYDLPPTNAQRLAALAAHLGQTPEAAAALVELREVLALVDALGLHHATLVLDPTLARGLSYYTGPIFEVAVDDVPIGSLGGGGRYDDLTGLMGVPNLPGVGLSVGADRVYDAMDHLGLWDQALPAPPLRALIVNFGGAILGQALQLASTLRQNGIPVEVYPEATKKLGKQFGFADKKGIPYVISLGEAEHEKGVVGLKDLSTGEQLTLSPQALIERLR